MKTKLNFKHILLLSIVTITLSSSCHKEGIGGKSSVSGSVKHHSAPIPNAVVYIKYGVTEFPGVDVTAYDDHSTADANANYSFNNLRKGNYYLYGVGFDNSLHVVVTGGIAIQLKYDKSISEDVPVTE